MGFEEKTKNKGKLLRCPHCKYEWEYRGTKKVKAQCPDCFKRVPVK